MSIKLQGADRSRADQPVPLGGVFGGAYLGSALSSPLASWRVEFHWQFYLRSIISLQEETSREPHFTAPTRNGEARRLTKGFRLILLLPLSRPHTRISSGCSRHTEVVGNFSRFDAKTM